MNFGRNMSLGLPIDFRYSSPLSYFLVYLTYVFSVDLMRAKHLVDAKNSVAMPQVEI